MRTLPAMQPSIGARQKTSGRGRSLLALGLCTLLAACGEQSGWPSESEMLPAADMKVSPEQRDAAAALSLTNWTMPADQSEFKQSIQCASALIAIANALKGASLAGDAEIQRVRRASEIFEQRAKRLAAGEGQTAEQADASLVNAKSKAAENVGESSRVALACIRSLGDQV